MSTYSITINPHIWNGIMPTGTVTGVLSHTPVTTNKSVGGEISPYGNPTVLHTHTPITFYRTVLGAITPAGAVSKQTSKNGLSGAITFAGVLTSTKIESAHIIDQAVEGGITPEGAGVGTQPDQAVEGEITPSGDVTTSVFGRQLGDITPSGELTGSLIEDILTQAVEGVITPSGSLAAVLSYLSYNLGNALLSGELTYNVIRAPLAPTLQKKGLAAKLDIIIEQGSSFYKEFMWVDENGEAIDLLYSTIHMTIKPKFGSSTVYASDRNYPFIYITKLSTTGKFSVYIKAETSADFNFTQAVYDIEVHHDIVLVSRLLEGRVLLSREVSSDV